MVLDLRVKSCKFPCAYYLRKLCRTNLTRRTPLAKIINHPTVPPEAAVPVQGPDKVPVPLAKARALQAEARVPPGMPSAHPEQLQDPVRVPARQEAQHSQEAVQEDPVAVQTGREGGRTGLEEVLAPREAGKIPDSRGIPAAVKNGRKRMKRIPNLLKVTLSSRA